MTEKKNSLFPHVSLKRVLKALLVVFGLFISGPFAIWIKKPDDIPGRRHQPEPDEPLGRDGQILPRK